VHAAKAGVGTPKAHAINFSISNILSSNLPTISGEWVAKTIWADGFIWRRLVVSFSCHETCKDSSGSSAM
jgi:hypothetical protein